MRILLTNDDGYYATGILKLREALLQAGHEVWVVAPDRCYSSKSAAITWGQPLTLKRCDTQIYSVSGTPVDCVNVALQKVMYHNFPDCVVSGSNRGLNTGVEVHNSGTVSAAHQSAQWGLPSIAVSVGSIRKQRDQFQKLYPTEERSYVYAAELVVSLIERWEAISWPTDEVLNLNYPDQKAKGLRIAQYDHHMYNSIEFKVLEEKKHEKTFEFLHPMWPLLVEDTENAHIFRGYASASFLSIKKQHSHYPNIEKVFQEVL